jgi:glutamine synthetase
LKEVGLEDAAYANQKQILMKISERISKVGGYVESMIQARKKANAIADTRERAIAYSETIKNEFFDKIRYHVDKLELLVADSYWQLPKYREMLFLR